MNLKTIVTIALLAFVGVSLVVALQKRGGRSAETEAGRQAAVGDTTPAVADSLADRLGSSQFTAVYFHAPHRCPTCTKIEAYAKDALSDEIDGEKIAWQVADYTAEENADIVEQCEVYTSTVVLLEVKDGSIVRWKNLEEVWNHTGDRSAFTSFMLASWDDFQQPSPDNAALLQS